ILPQHWTPEVVISRHQGLLGNVDSELDWGRAVALLGEEKVKELANFHPWDPDITLDPDIKKEILFEDILGLYNAYRRPVKFLPEDVIPEYRGNNEMTAQLEEPFNELEEFSSQFSGIGSNNWIIDGNKSVSGSPLLANDPHRTQAVPSLRYMVHLKAPGWDVIGGGEPEIPGVSIGHNEYGAWGLTVFRTDGEDIYILKTNPENSNQYWFEGEWVEMYQVEDSILVKGLEPYRVVHRYTNQGPVTYRDTINHIAVAVRCAWLEPGGSPYLASLRMDQAKTWEEFREACNFSHIPGENMIWADKKGNIGWQAVGIAPIRTTHSGLVPVPGDGRYEWSGYLPIIEKPNLANPENGFFATANENVVPEGYPNNGAVGFEWSDSFRGDRIREVLSGKEKVSMEDMKKLQTDYYSIPASKLVPFLKELSTTNDKVKKAKEQLLQWDYVLDKSSVGAGIYVAWEKALMSSLNERNVPEQARQYISIPLTNCLNWVLNNEEDKIGNREELLAGALEKAIENLSDKLGDEMSGWTYGQEKYKHIKLYHPLSSAVNEETKAILEVGPLPRGGNGYTVGATGGGDNQTHGASFRLLVDCADWDKTQAMNNPGQSGNPSSKYYNNLFEHWANDGFFPLFYSDHKVDSVAEEVILLVKGSD
ncbi:MAG: penicillin acylase family protein, partial [Cyclobacteriaceae bacterium]|nr:penicillin acylase family protein [Cyclobacteriaceae bacterium]